MRQDEFRGGYFLSVESKPSEKETLTSAVNWQAHCVRYFPKGLSFRSPRLLQPYYPWIPEVDSDIPAMIGASAALCAIRVSHFMGPLGAARVGYQDGAYVA